MRLHYTALPLLFALAIAAPPHAAFAQAQLSVSVTLAPPALPVYAQPALPAPGYLWTPGYWAWNGGGYYWVPGTWIMPPAVGMLWTPGYWAASGGGFVWHAGYWGQHVGFYGGINYGYGYNGSDYVGGRWQNGAFYYNTAVNNVHDVHVTNVYRQTVIAHAASHVSYSGAGGVAAQPGKAGEAAEHESHAPPTAVQAQHESAAAADHRSLATENHGRPPVAATPKAAVLTGPGIVPARAAARRPAAHAAASPPVPRAAPPSRPIERAAATRPAGAPSQPKAQQREPEKSGQPDEHR